MKTFRIADIEKILMETDRKIEDLEREKIVYAWGGDTIKILEISGLKSNAFDEIHKLLLDD